SHKSLRLFVPVLPLSQFNEHPTAWEERIGEALLERAESVPSFFHRSTKFHPLRFPLTTHRVNVINLQREVLHALPVFLDELADLRLHDFVPALHECNLRMAPLHYDCVHRRLV